MLKEGNTKYRGSFNVRHLGFSHTEGVHNKFSPLGGHEQF